MTNKFKIGDKVVPISKSIDNKLVNSKEWNNAKKRNQPYLYVGDIETDYIVCSANNNRHGDCFEIQDLIPYVEDVTLKQNNMQIIGYKLKNEFIHLKEAVVKMSDAVIYPPCGYYISSRNPYSIDNFTKAGVLDLWFEPVYKEDEFKVGDWVIGWHHKDGNVNAIPWKIAKIQKGYAYKDSGHNTGITDINRLATTEEIKNHLVALAKEKGFVDGLPLSNIQQVNGNVSHGYNIEWQYDSYEPELDRLTMHGATIYKDGIWATIKPQETVVSVGGKFDVIIENGKIWHKNDDITDFVRQLITSFSFNDKFDGYSAVIKDVIFSSTGCQKVETRLSDWIVVLDAYNELKL